MVNMDPKMCVTGEHSVGASLPGLNRRCATPSVSIENAKWIVGIT